MQNRVSEKEAWENLANAIVTQAAADYRSACKKLRRKPDDLDAAYLKADAERFFRGGDCSLYTTVRGDVILQMLKKEQEEIHERKRVSRTVPQKDRSDRSPAGQDRRNTRLRRKVHFRS